MQRGRIVWRRATACRDGKEVSMPFGGYKQSGIGREFGKYAVEGFTETKSVCIAH
jgi:phenylacetaldehyde dehydrogenase